MMMIFGSLSGVYIIPTIYTDYSNLEHAADNKVSFIVDKASVDDGDGNVPQQPADVDDFARNAVSDVHHRAKQLRNNSSVVSFFVYFIQFLCDAELETYGEC